MHVGFRPNICNVNVNEILMAAGTMFMVHLTTLLTVKFVVRRMME
jgi:hypothetical protein